VAVAVQELSANPEYQVVEAVMVALVYIILYPDQMLLMQAEVEVQDIITMALLRVRVARAVAVPGIL